MLRTNLVRSDLRATSVVRSTGEAVWTNTKDASPTSMLVPMPMLMFDLKSAGSITFSGATPFQHPLRKSVEDREPARGNDWGTEAMPVVAELPSMPVAVPEAPGMSELSQAPEPEAEAPAEKHQANGEPSKALEPKPEPSAETHRIELIIDSLPRHELVEAISVTVDSLGDKVFTATVHALDLTGTGNSLGDALIIVKEQIEILYDRLVKAAALDTNEKNYLNYLQSHIKIAPTDNPRHSKRSIWR